MIVSTQPKQCVFMCYMLSWCLRDEVSLLQLLHDITHQTIKMFSIISEQLRLSLEGLFWIDFLSTFRYSSKLHRNLYCILTKLKMSPSSSNPVIRQKHWYWMILQNPMLQNDSATFNDSDFYVSLSTVSVRATAVWKAFGYDKWNIVMVRQLKYLVKV